MEQTAEAGRGPGRDTGRGGVVCPSLILSYKVVCDKKGTMHEPTRAHLWEYCTTPLHSRCPLQIVAATPCEAVR